jgi:hypothetical protein
LGVIAILLDAQVFGPSCGFFFTPVFGLAGFVLGILVTVLSGKSWGIWGIILSVLPMVGWFAKFMLYGPRNF